MGNENKQEMPFDCDAGMGYDFGVHPYETAIRKHEKYFQGFLTTEGRSGFLLLASRMMTSAAKAGNKDDFMCICLATLKILREEVERLEGVNAQLALKSPHQPQYVGGQLVGFSRGDTTGEYRGVARPNYMPPEKLTLSLPGCKLPEDPKLVLDAVECVQVQLDGKVYHLVDPTGIRGL